MTEELTGPRGPATRRRLRATRRPPAAEPVADTAAVESAEPGSDGEPSTEEGGRVVIPLDEPREGLPDVVADPTVLADRAAALAAGHGPIAIDAERASGYRYGQSAYLIQLRRQGAGTVLIDPVPFPTLDGLATAIQDCEWVIHAATQDLPCLAEVGLRPSRLFDTELGARLAGRPRVGLGTVVEHYLGYSLAKEHSAVDWSTRPLPDPWLRYAALDVEVLVDLRDAVADDLATQGKLDWALEEFEALLSFTGPPVRQDPWRRTSGMHKIRKSRGLAIVRELWQARDRLAAERDVSPGRLLPDAVIVALAADPDLTPEQINTTRELRAARRNLEVWLAAIETARALPGDQLPPASIPTGGPPPVRAWKERDAAAAARLTEVRAHLATLSEELTVPVENLLTPDLMRRVLWDPPAAEAVQDALRDGGARPWQVALVGPLVAQAVADHPST